MAANLKRIPILVLLGLLAVLGLFLGLQQFAKAELKKVLSDKLPPHIQVTHEQLHLNLFTGKAQLANFSIKINNKDAKLHTILNAENIVLTGISYWKYFAKDTLQFDLFSIQKPELRHYPYLMEEEKDTSAQDYKKIPSIKINKIEIVDGIASIMQDSADSLNISLSQINLVMHHVHLNKKSLQNKVPIGYNNLQLSLEELFVNMGDFETMSVRKLDIKHHKLTVSNFSIQSKYDKKELSKKATIERDHISFETDSIVLHQLDFGFRKNRFFISSDSLELIKPNLAVYRDKRLADDPKSKPMYSAMIRNLPFDIDIPKLAIHDGRIDYDELSDQGGIPGHLEFDALEASILNISNYGPKDRITEIEIQTLFMNHAKFHMKWTFNVHNESDEFLLLGSLKDFDTKSVNSFLTSGIRATVDGKIQELYFTINGNKVSSNGEMKMKYSKLNFNVLDKDRKGVNKFLSTLGNLFVSSDSKKGTEKGYRYGEIKAARAQNKSFFNYLWLNVSDGVVSILTGSGKKKN